MSRVKKSASEMGMPSSTFFRELTDGLTLFCSISEMVLLVTPTRLASSRWLSPLDLRTSCRRAPMSITTLSLASLCCKILYTPGSCGQFHAYMGGSCKVFSTR